MKKFILFILMLFTFTCSFGLDIKTIILHKVEVAKLDVKSLTLKVKYGEVSKAELEYKKAELKKLQKDLKVIKKKDSVEKSVVKLQKQLDKKENELRLLETQIYNMNYGY